MHLVIFSVCDYIDVFYKLHMIPKFPFENYNL